MPMDAESFLAAAAAALDARAANGYARWHEVVRVAKHVDRLSSGSDGAPSSRAGSAAPSISSMASLSSFGPRSPFVQARASPASPALSRSNSVANSISNDDAAAGGSDAGSFRRTGAARTPDRDRRRLSSPTASPSQAARRLPGHAYDFSESELYSSLDTVQEGLALARAGGRPRPISPMQR